MILKKLESEYDPTDRLEAVRVLHETSRRAEFATGVIYVEPDKEDFIEVLNLVEEPLATLPLERVRPSKAAFEKILQELR